jgi:hypothetical protein
MVVNAEGLSSGSPQSQIDVLADHYSDSTQNSKLSLITGSAPYALFNTDKVFVRGGTNAEMTYGLTIDQEDADDEILTLKSSDVAHGITDVTETDSFGILKKAQASSGGLNIGGWKDADGNPGYALTLDAVLDEDTDTTKSTSGYGNLMLRAYRGNGTTVQALNSGGNVLCVRNSNTTEFIIDAEGDFHYNGSDGGAFDEFDDAALVRAFSQATVDSGRLIRSRWDEFVGYNEQSLIDAGILGAPRSEGGLINGAQLQRLFAGAIWEAFRERRELQEEVQSLRGQLRLLSA